MALLVAAMLVNRIENGHDGDEHPRGPKPVHEIRGVGRDGCSKVSVGGTIIVGERGIGEAAPAAQIRLPIRHARSVRARIMR